MLLVFHADRASQKTQTGSGASRMSFLQYSCVSTCLWLPTLPLVIRLSTLFLLSASNTEKRSVIPNRPSISRMLYDLRGTPENKSLWEVRRRIIPFRRRIIGSIGILVNRGGYSPIWEFVQEVARSTSSQEIEGAYFNYVTHPHRTSEFADFLLGRPSLGRALRFYRRLKGEWTPMRNSHSAHAARQN